MQTAMVRMLSRFFKRQKKNHSRPVFNLQLDLTHKCNFNCTHCYQGNFNCTDKELTLSEWICVLDQYMRLARMLDVTPALILSGGEPLLCAHLWRLIEYTRSSCHVDNIYLLTNGALLDDDACKSLRRLSVKVQLSIEGPQAEVNDPIRGEGSFQKIMKAAVLLCRYNVPYTYQMVLRKNVKGFIEGMFELARATSADAMNFVRLIPFNIDGEYDTAEMLEGKALKEVFERILEMSRKYDISTNTHQPLWCLLEDGLGHPSSAGFLGMTIDPVGDIHVTSRTKEVVGAVTDNDGLIKTYLDNEVMKRLRKGDVNVCQNCDYFKQCRGDRSVSYILNGDFFGPDDHCWLLQEERGDKD